MSGGAGGSIQDMIVRYRYNMNQLRRKNRFKKERTFRNINPEDIKIPNTKIKTKKATKEQLEKIKKRTIREEKKEKYVQITLLLVSIVLFSFLVFKIYSRISESNKNEILNQQQLQTSQALEKYNNYIELITGGDKYLKQNLWSNALLYYTEALELFPQDYDAKYRIALVLTYKCQSKNKNCNDAKIILDSLINVYPKKSELFELRASYYYILGDSLKAEQDYNTIDKLMN